ncbi:MAG: ExeM/NucH family extracellular endonuclease, partial [Nocardioides sp.]|nr:ExeM/NucH family extracellular endonuclease [Nocardioides sp.]
MISELYGGGGNSGATLKADFGELYTPTDAAIAVDGRSVQYRSSGGTAAPSGITPLTGQVPAQGHYLIQEAEGAAGTDALPTPDATGTIAMSGKAFTALLVEGTEPVDPGTGAFAGSEEILDLVGVDSNVFETAKASAINNPTSASRNATGVDTDDNSADFTTGVPSPTNAAGESTGGGDEPGDPVDATIPDIQGEGATSPLEGKAVTTSGVVTAAYPEGGLYGFYLQVPGSGAADLDLSGGPASQGVFVRQQQSAGDVTVQPGDHVEVNGAVGEYAGATQVTVSDAASIETLPEAADPAVATSTWPSTPAERESLEGMLYRPAGNFTITETYATINYGELGLAKGNKPLIQWTDAARPGTSEAAAIKADNAKRGIVLDDGSSTGFKGKGDLTPPYISNDEPVRVDAKATFDEDVIFTEGGSPDAPTYRFQPLAPVIGPDNAASPATFANTRTEAPDEALINADGESDLKVASFNVLNYFTTLGDADDDNVGDNGCEAYQDRDGDGVNVRGGCDLRGAWDPEDFERQQTKIVGAINDLDADVVGLMEIENSAALGEDADEATETLVSALNDAAGSKVWAANPSSADLPPATDQDVITNAIIYKAASVERTGEARALGDQSAEGQAFGNAREPIAQAFTPKGGGEPFLFVVNHFKSKGSVGPFPGDEDAGDGQGNSNASRVKQAQALRDWLPGIEEEADTESVMLAGDFNSYTMEDPLEVLYDAGYADVEQKFDLGKWSYSYSGLSGSLDHVLVNEAAGERSTGADIWNINGGESVALEYSRWNYWATDFHTQTPYRSSDHDPVVLGLTAGEQGGEDGEVDLNLLGVNDFHGRINANTVKWAGTVEQLTKAAGDSQTLLVGAGDLIGASEFASAIAGDQPTIDMFNALGLDASAVGNHEFDKGYDDLTDRVIGGEGARNAKWDYLGANVYEKGTEEPALPEYSTYDVDGVTVGVIGVVTEETKSLVSPDGISMLDFGNPVEAVNRVSAELSDGDQANGEADVIVASFHAGAQKGEGSTFEDEVAKGGEFAEMVNLDEDVDVILNGHTHQEYAWDAPVGANGKTRPILQTGQYGDNVGQVTLTVDQETGDVVSYEAKNVARTETPDEELVAEFPRVAAIKEIVDEALAAAAEVGNEPVGEISGDITRARTAAGGEDRGAESTLGNLVGNALRDGLPEGMEADLGVTNPGGLRTDLLYAGDTADNPENTDGVVTYAEANSVLPFVNNVSLVDLTGAQLKSVLEQQWQPDGADRPFLALGTSDNVRVIQDPEAPRGERIVSVSIDGVELDPETTYTVSTFSFLATGGDNFTAFTEGASRDTGLVDRELWISYLKGNKPLDPDYARHQVVSADYPSTVSAGDEVSFTVSNLDLTSAGSPTNTDVEVSLVKGEETLDSGSFPVTDGSATVEFTADAGLEGQWGVVLTAEPSGTVVGPVSSASDPDPGTVTATVETFVYGAKGTVEAQVTSEGEVSGKVEVSEGDKVLGSGKVAADGSVSVEVDSVDIGAGGHQLSVDYLGNG